MQRLPCSPTSSIAQDTVATTNHERVGKAMELLKAGLAPFVEREVQAAIKAHRVSAGTLRRVSEDARIGERPVSEWDAAALLKLMWETWNDVFRKVLGPAERGFVGELRGHRNRWAHQEPFSGDDAYRAADTAHRLLTAVSAEQAADVERLKMELLRVRFDTQARGERSEQAGPVAAGGADGAGNDPDYSIYENWNKTTEKTRTLFRALKALAESLGSVRTDAFKTEMSFKHLAAPGTREPVVAYVYLLVRNGIRVYIYEKHVRGIPLEDGFTRPYDDGQYKYREISIRDKEHVRKTEPLLRAAYDRLSA